MFVSRTFAHHFFSREGPTFGRISSYFRIAGQPCMRTSRLDVLSEVLHASFDMSFFAGMPKDCYVKLFSPPWYVWCYGHTKENIFLQSVLKQGIWSKYNMKSENLCCVWILPLDFTVRTYGYVFSMHPAIYRICNMSRSCGLERLRRRTFIKMAAWNRKLGTSVNKNGHQAMTDGAPWR